MKNMNQDLREINAKFEDLKLQLIFDIVREKYDDLEGKHICLLMPESKRWQYVGTLKFTQVRYAPERMLRSRIEIPFSVVFSTERHGLSHLIEFSSSDGAILEFFNTEDEALLFCEVNGYA